jgi:signal peptide peptidase SppA
MTTASRLWQIDTRWLQAYAARAVRRGIRADGMDPEKIDDYFYDMWSEMLGFDTSAPLDYTEDGIAILTIAGPMIKGKSSPFVSNYAAIEDALDELLEQPPLAVVLKLDSPGGMVAGVERCTTKLRQLADTTLVVASVNGDCLSAAYRLASQCGSIWASDYSNIGSLGTYWQLLDMSAAYEAEGLRSVLLTTGPLKGVGAPGEAITPEQTAFLQAKVDEMNARFMQDLASGRGLSAEQLAGVADGRWWLAAEAAGLGLVDQLGNLDDVLAAIRAQFSEMIMARQTLQPATAGQAAAGEVVAAPAQTTEPAQPVAAAPGLAEYMQAFGDAEGARMFLAGTSWSEAQAAQLQTLRGELQDVKAENAQLKARLSEAAAMAAGETSPVATPQGEAPKKRSLADVSSFRKI